MTSVPRRPGFTITELLVVIGILGVLLALLMPAVMHVRDAGKRVECANNLYQLGVALQQYHGEHGSLPPGCSYRNGADPYPHMSWLTRLLPYVEREALWREAQQAFQTDKWFENNPPHTGLGTVVPLFTCPSDSRIHVAKDFGPFRAAFTSYLGVEGTNQFTMDGVLFLDSHVRIQDLRDGSSNTLLVGERPPSANLTFGWWYAGWGQDKDGSAEMLLGVREHNVRSLSYPNNCPAGPYEFGQGYVDDPCSVFHFWSLHPRGGHFLFGDGGVRFVKYSANHLMPALATRRGGETVPSLD